MSSLWDYLLPGDLRARNQSALPSPPLTSPEEDVPTQNARHVPPPERLSRNARRVRQDSLLYGGLLFTGLSILVTRRSLKRKTLPFPSLQTTNQTPGVIKPGSKPGATKPEPLQKGDGAFDAAEALGLATLNTCSIALLAAGVVGKWFDIADIEDLRDGVRKGVGFDVYGGDSEADKEMEGWIADVLSRKDGEGGIQESIALKLKELEEIERKKGGKR
ncbi:hypothetical protein LTR56_007355 [Elasticomyces elasticus]|nr:hypothetical protein LTR22_019653 [Elasticomyces elasticus]KAK3648532.1 hypothetical protein LTR56_007355 [Elasticomyces elasticus]KAK4930460.1 hypothetical protein LTR49_002868 [Elasticomyces elasticus]KAK5745056.1 hypothetical protein LTS12_023248 [Elasticomyces elasticus]